MKKSLTLFTAVVIVVVGIGLVVFFYLYNNQKEAKTESDKTKTTQQTAKEVACGDLKADKGVIEGKVPFAPVVRAAISGSYDPEQPICDWSIDNAKSHTSFPVKGECVFGGKSIMTTGKHTISYSLTGKSCSKSIEITVTK